jgi:biotin operon repressor
MSEVREGNRLLERLRAADRALIEPHLVRLGMAAGDILYEPGDDVRFVHFPVGPTLVSFLVLFEGGGSAETALIGCEGAIGGIVSRGRLPAFARSIVQYPGDLLRLETAKLDAAKAQSPSLAQLFARYADCLLAQIFQSAACSAAHSIEQRTARWLLAAQDRTGLADVPVTQERLSALLGVGRSYVSRVIAQLKAGGAIEVRRGAIRIADRERLTRASCGCTDAVRAHFEEVLAGVYPAEAGAEAC